ncbi:MAG TPA: hypothetical protein PKE47_00025 [Verrucomicrobiota bacterium]|nr:hypothetical protein [Verrucomicrobiota bacterium]
MNRPFTYLLGPEAALKLASLVVSWFCARHNSSTDRDSDLRGKPIWAIPLLLSRVAYATILAPGAKNWWWLGRAIGFTYLAAFVCGARLIHGPGSGSRGQDVAFILSVMMGSVAIAIPGAMILAATKPGFANRFEAHRFPGSILTNFPPCLSGSR